MYDHELLYTFIGPGLVANDVIGINIASVKCLLIFNCSWIHLGFWVSPQVNQKLRSIFWWAAPWKLFEDMHWYELIALFCSGELIPEVCPTMYMFATFCHTMLPNRLLQLLHLHSVDATTEFWLGTPAVLTNVLWDKRLLGSTSQLRIFLYLNHKNLKPYTE